MSVHPYAAAAYARCSTAAYAPCSSRHRDTASDAARARYSSGARPCVAPRCVFFYGMTMDLHVVFGDRVIVLDCIFVR